MPYYNIFIFVAALLVGSLAGFNPVEAQESIETATQKLTGGSNREWLSGDVKAWMGTDPACRPGKIYRFSKDHTAHIEECIDGMWKRKNLPWSISKDGPLDILVTLDNRTYTVIFFMQKGHQHMILREGARSKIDPVIDQTFVLSED